MTDTLIVSRRVLAAPARVYEAWTRPEQLVRWFGPPGGRCTHADVELRVGGAFQLENRLASGERVRIEGRYLELHPPRRLVFTWSGPASPTPERVTVTIEPDGAGALVTVIHERIPTEPVKEGHRRGWDACLRGLAGLLQTQVSGERG